MSKPTTDARGRRYSRAERVEVLDYIAQVNREKGRGGQRAAHEKFGIAFVTLKMWTQLGPGADEALSESIDATGRTLSELKALAGKIDALERKISRMREEYQDRSRSM